MFWNGQKELLSDEFYLPIEVKPSLFDDDGGTTLENVPSRDACGVTCVYFSAAKAPIDEAILILNGEGKGPINNVCFPSSVSWTYAPAGKALVSATVLGTGHGSTMTEDVKTQLQDWFGSEAERFEHLKTYEIPFALPSQTKLDPVERAPQIRSGLYRCGDDMDTASINGAMASGRRAAEAIQAEITRNSSADRR